MYPLGSCTMKYTRASTNLWRASQGLANGHPYQPAKISQGAMRIMKTLSDWPDRNHRMDAITLQPAGARMANSPGC